MFGSGRIAFAATGQSATMIDSSPRRLEMTSPLDEDVVAEVDELLPLLQRLLAHCGERHHRLDAAAVAGLQRREAELAGVAAEHDATGDRSGHAGLGAGLEVAEPLAQRRGSCR